MSRIGKLPIPVPKGVTVKIDKTHVSVKGPKGELGVDTHGRVNVIEENGEIKVQRFDDSRQQRAFHGLYQRLIANCVTGVTDGFKKTLEIQGIGYRAEMKGKSISLALGFSHPVLFEAPQGITITVPTPTSVIVEGADKQAVGQVAAKIRGYRPPEPYKGKGVRYSGERVKLKEGKSSGR
ncbi:MAG: 50S ribosomal protein L6 [Sumerlaeia bacterium]